MKQSKDTAQLESTSIRHVSRPHQKNAFRSNYNSNKQYTMSPNVKMKAISQTLKKSKEALDGLHCSGQELQDTSSQLTDSQCHSRSHSWHLPSPSTGLFFGLFMFTAFFLAPLLELIILVTMSVCLSVCLSVWLHVVKLFFELLFLLQFLSDSHETLRTSSMCQFAKNCGTDFGNFQNYWRILLNFTFWLNLWNTSSGVI